MENLVKIGNDLENGNKPQNFSYLRKSKKYYEWLTLEISLEWIKDEKLIDYMFGEYSHPEITRKSGEFLQKMCKQGLFKNNLIWSVLDQNFYEDIISVSLEVITMIAID